jgi:hypothetical protein
MIAQRGIPPVPPSIPYMGSPAEPALVPASPDAPAIGRAPQAGQMNS